jgi:hypothetical protein
MLTDQSACKPTVSEVVTFEPPIKKGKVNFSLLASQSYFYCYVSYSYYLMLIFQLHLLLFFHPTHFAFELVIYKAGFVPTLNIVNNQ